MAYSHCARPGTGQVQGMGLGLMGPNILYRNVHTDLRQGQEPDPFEFFLNVFTEFSDFSDKINIILKRGLLHSNLLSLV